MPLFFQGGNDGGGGRGGARMGGENKNDNEDDAVPSPSMGMAGELVNVLRRYRQRVPRELLALGPPPPLVDPPLSGGGKDVGGEGGNMGGGRAGAATSIMTAIAEGGTRRG